MERIKRRQEKMKTIYNIICKGCEGEFETTNKNKLYHSITCKNKRSNRRHKERNSKYYKNYYKEHIDKIRKRTRKHEYRIKQKRRDRNNNCKKQYGITFKEKMEIKKSQKGRCSICNRLFKSSRDCHLDHDHKINKVRNLLCSNCNHILGYSGENIKILKKAIWYLQKWSG